MDRPRARLRPRPGAVVGLVCALLVALAAGRTWGEDGREETIQRMLRIVLDSNPTLLSQQALVRESEKLPEVRSAVALTGVSLSLATSVWDLDTGTFRFVPGATLGTSLSFRDPARALNVFALKKEREAARQEYLRIQNELLADLLATVREALKLAGRRDNLEKLQDYLKDYSDLIDRQVRAGVAGPEPDKLWELRGRLIGIEGEIEDVKNELSTMRLEAALRLGGDRWQELLDLLVGLDVRSAPTAESGPRGEG